LSIQIVSDARTRSTTNITNRITVQQYIQE
jgi:hypothetical protein